MAVWIMIPDRIDNAPIAAPRFGVFVTTVALAARYDALIAVVAGTTLGMMIANVPAVLLGEIAATKLPQRLVYGIAAALFLAMRIIVLVVR